MRTINKCIEAGAKEMCPGYYNEKYDKYGNKILTYVNDTRREFIESIKTAKGILTCGFDETIKDEIKIIEAELDEEYKQLIEAEKLYWGKISLIVKKNLWGKGIFFQEGRLNKELEYYQNYISFEVDCFRKMFEALMSLIKRVDFFEDIGISV